MWQGEGAEQVASSVKLRVLECEMEGRDTLGMAVTRSAKSGEGAAAHVWGLTFSLCFSALQCPSVPRLHCQRQLQHLYSFTSCCFQNEMRSHISGENTLQPIVHKELRFYTRITEVLGQIYAYSLLSHQQYA